MQTNLDSSKLFLKDFKEAADGLMEILPIEKMCKESWLVVAISKEAIKLAELICSKIKIGYDILFCETIFAPNNSSLPIAKVSETEEIVIHDELINAFLINLDYVYGEAKRKYEEKILPQVYKYRKGELISSLKVKNVLLVDVGCESGLTVLTGIKSALNAGAKSVSFATPVIASNVFISLDLIVDEIYTINRVQNFINTTYYYQNFEELKYEEIKAILDNSSFYIPFKKIEEVKLCSTP